MSFNHSASNCMKSLLIICLKSAKVQSKQCYNKSIFLDTPFQSYSLGWKKDFLTFFYFLIFFYLTNEGFDEC